MVRLIDILQGLLLGLLCGYVAGILFPIVMERAQRWRRGRGTFVYPMHRDYPARAALILSAVNLVRAFFFDNHYFEAAWWLLWVAAGAFLAARKK